MSDESIVKTKAGELYKAICQSEWNPTVTGVVIAFLSVLMMAWWRPWGAVGALRNWGDWVMYWLARLLGTDAGIEDSAGLGANAAVAAAYRSVGAGRPGLRQRECGDLAGSGFPVAGRQATARGRSARSRRVFPAEPTLGPAGAG